jgi:hypothetical protein
MQLMIAILTHLPEVILKRQQRVVEQCGLFGANALWNAN